VSTASRLEQIEEAMADLEAVFADPECFHSPGSRDPRPVQDYATSLASEFVGAYRDDEVTGRLAKLVDAEDAGSPKDARRHLIFVRRKVAMLLTAWQAEIAAKPQVAETSDCRVSSPRPVVADGARPPVAVGS
jgi:hypothetical protein